MGETKQRRLRGVVCVLFDDDERRREPPKECPESIGALADYAAFHADAERRLAAGEKQRRCTRCGLWTWLSEAKGHTFSGAFTDAPTRPRRTRG